jgi:peptide/nickel transport system substrate-binding protein
MCRWVSRRSNFARPDTGGGYVRPTRQYLVRFAALVAGVALIAAACGGSSSKSSNGSSTPKYTIDNSPVPTGGTLTIAANEQPTCFDWLGSCATSSWGTYVAQLETVPFAIRDVPVGNPSSGNIAEQPGAVLTAMPTLETTPVEKITYPIAPAAVWSDGVPITCDDFVYTVDQQQHGNDLLSSTGYDDIDKVTCPDPKTAVVTYKPGKMFVNWTQLFSGTVGILPSHILKGKDRAKALNNGYSWSGGPWIASWTKGDNITLTPNAKYWGSKPHLDKVVVKFITDSAAEFNALKSGQVDAIYPQPQLDTVDQVAAGVPGFNTVYNANTAAVEMLMMQNAKFPLNDVKVRQAFSYAIDRAAIVKKLFGALGVDTPSNSLNPYVFTKYSDQNAFAGYTLDLQKVNDLMTSAGWTKGADGIWAKGGKRASFPIEAYAGNKRRELTEQVVQQQAKAAGFEITINNKKNDDVNTDYGNGDYVLGLVANAQTAYTPGLCSSFCSDQIPSAANQNSGQNATWTNIPALDTQLKIVDNSLDDAARVAAAKQGDQIMAANVVSLPLDPLPDILLWSKKVKGPIQDNSIESMFWNLDQWGISS